MSVTLPCSHRNPSARALASTSRQRDSRACGSPALCVPTPCHRPSLLKLNTGARSGRREAGRTLGDQVVQDQRLGAGLRVVGQHHVRLRVARAADLRAHVHQAQPRHRHAERQQAEVLGDGVVLAVAVALGQRLERAGPVVGLAPDLASSREDDAAVEEAVDGAEPRLFVERGACAASTAAAGSAAAAAWPQTLAPPARMRTASQARGSEPTDTSSASASAASRSAAQARTRGGHGGKGLWRGMASDDGWPAGTGHPACLRPRTAGTAAGACGIRRTARGPGVEYSRPRGTGLGRPRSLHLNSSVTNPNPTGGPSPTRQYLARTPTR